MSEGYVERPSRWRWALTANLWCGFVEVASGIVTILTLGYYTPPWSFTFIAWRTKRDIERRMNTNGSSSEREQEMIAAVEADQANGDDDDDSKWVPLPRKEAGNG
jgi:hypothetical protein